MEIISGTPAEIVEYQRLVGDNSEVRTTASVATDDGAAASAVGPSVEPSMEGTQPMDDNMDDDEYWLLIRNVILTRAMDGRHTDGAKTRRMLAYLDRAESELTVVAEVGKSKRTPWQDGISDYVMIYADGPRYLGAAVYLRPTAGNLHFRLQAQDVEDLIGEDPRLTVRNVRSDNVHAVQFDLSDDDAVDQALELTKRALAKINQSG